jgi:hypothetical protein
MNPKVHRRSPFAVARSKKPAPPAIKNRSAVHSEEYARHFAWVDWMSARTGRSDAALAKDAGLNVNYLYRKRSEGTVLGATQIRMLSEHYGLPGPDNYLQPGAAGLSDEGAPYDAAAPGTDSILKLMIEAALKDRASAAPWVLKTRAMEDAGYLAGDIVVSDASVPPNAGDAVVAQVYDLRSGSAETVFRILEPPYLIAASSDPGLRKPLLIDNERVKVMGTITQSFRARRS